MRFDYQYRTSANELKEGSLSAPSRDAAYAMLKKDGINPSRVVLAAGFWNYLASIGRRGLAIVVLALVVLGLVLYQYSTPTSTPIRNAYLPRHQIANLPDSWLNELSKYFSPMDVYIATLAQPGCDVSIDVVPSPDMFSVEYLEAELPASLPSEPRWVTELKGIILGIKEESLALIRGGKSPNDVILWLRERQRMEAAYREQILGGEGTTEEKALRLRAMGL